MTCLLVPSVRHDKDRFQFEQPRTHQPRQKRRVKSTRRRHGDRQRCHGARFHTRESVSVSPLACPLVVVRPSRPPHCGTLQRQTARRESSGPVRLEWLVGKAPFFSTLAVRPKRGLIGSCLRGPASGPRHARLQVDTVGAGLRRQGSQAGCLRHGWTLVRDAWAQSCSQSLCRANSRHDDEYLGGARILFEKGRSAPAVDSLRCICA